LNIGQVVIFANKEKILEVHAEFLIVGAGIAGTSLALELHKRGSSVEIIDAYNPLSSSRVAAGMMNPMVPRNVQKAWYCDAIYPSVFEYYEEWQSVFGVGSPMEGQEGSRPPHGRGFSLGGLYAWTARLIGTTCP
jgi:flavin-dependent dehydrogenase